MFLGKSATTHTAHTSSMFTAPNDNNVNSPQIPTYSRENGPDRPMLNYFQQELDAMEFPKREMRFFDDGTGYIQNAFGRFYIAAPGTDSSSLGLPNPADESDAPVMAELNFTIPDGKLSYPEPFIASPSYLHTDLTFLHIFQYWYWLWFMFVFLIIFFFISFVAVVRWNTTRVKPRRETRGVSRSKCGDLITACVPVSWAISIIVSESTDAADLNDGFGTSELVVGVRAYQWGWEYYYPQAIDLHHNVSPQGSVYQGRSLRYNYSSGANLSSNYLWKMYQSKSEDRVLTPAHLLVTPLDSANSVNFLSFKDIGTNVLSESEAFAKIRNSSKVYNTHLVQTPTSSVKKFYDLHSLYGDENAHLTSMSFGARKQYEIASISSIGNGLSLTSLDDQSFKAFLSENSLVSPSVDSSQSLNPYTSVESRSDMSRPAPLYLTSLLTSNVSSKTLFSHPLVVNLFGNDSDKPGLEIPALKLSSPSLASNALHNESLVSVSSFSEDFTSQNSYRPLDTTANQNVNGRSFNVNGPSSDVLATDQTTRHLPDLSPSRPNPNLARSHSAVSSLVKVTEPLNTSTTPSNLISSMLTGYSDSTQTSRVLGSSTFSTTLFPAVLSSNPARSAGINYDSTVGSVNASVTDATGTETKFSVSKFSPASDAMTGPRDKAPKSLNAAYWSTFWSDTAPEHRVNGSMVADYSKMNFYLPTFYAYSDYDFRNDQALDMLEELFWETSYSGYNFYDYMTLAKNEKQPGTVLPNEQKLDGEFRSSVLGLDLTNQSLNSPISKDLSLLGDAYSTSVQMDDYVTNPSYQALFDYSLIPSVADLGDIDSSATDVKSLERLVEDNSGAVVSVFDLNLLPRSYISVFNYFRSDFDSFSFQSDRRTSPNLVLNDSNIDYATIDGSSIGAQARLSNPATLRSSVRNSIVNYNAFQKVFKPRFDELRSHTQTVSFAEMSEKQPFLTDSKVPYLNLLGKNRDSFFNTPVYTKSLGANLNPYSGLIDSLNAPTYDFPFLLAKTSDTTRFTWIDWFAKWKHIEVQPSSVSKYSTIGVPYLRKPFDFNSTGSETFQDTELYFTRVAKSRRHYLPMWLYSPFTYNKSYVWTASRQIEDRFWSQDGWDTAVTNSSLKGSCEAIAWCWRSSFITPNTTNVPNYSFSGNEVYHKSTWRPKSSIQAYYAKLSKLTDLLSRREHLWRRYNASAAQFAPSELPLYLSATPSHPLLNELKSSFALNDPSSFSSEETRDFLYSSIPFFKFIQIRAADKANKLSEGYSIQNISPISEYLFFYFMNTQSTKAGNLAETYKSQFRPLRKGISDMLRLHATGAVAMPAEIRLQVLASSRDVIHSWAIPSASVKIDCVPGYTSHRTIKFVLTGVYWGQCQEICGRYHHWMPIVLHIVKPDLFFLWCVTYVHRRNSVDQLFNSPVKL